MDNNKSHKPWSTYNIHFFLSLLVVSFAVSCTVSTANNSYKIKKLEVLEDNLLMAEFGEMLRKAYRTSDNFLLLTERFLSLQKEIEQRNFVSNKDSLDIERGIVYAGMPLWKALASVDNMNEVDILVIRAEQIRAFRSPETWLDPNRQRDTFITCGNKVVSLFVSSGLITPETYSGKYGYRQIKFQTNFKPGFWKKENYEERIRGNKVFSKPQKFADRLDHRWSLFSDNAGNFTKPSIWHTHGTHNYNHKYGIDINDLMRRHIRRKGTVCD